ncbi:MAG: acyl-ACP--UDP-N-acetylglucosamine O-acyltransferase, partial [Verrucomicrobiota bacterium]
MSHIHNTAQISPKAEVGEDVIIESFVVVEAGCVIGDGCRLRHGAIVTGNTVMGRDNDIGYGAVIGADPQDTAFEPKTASRVVIGDRNCLREHVTIHRGTAEGSETRLGNDCFLMVGAHLAHNCLVGDHVTLVNAVLLAGHVTVEDRAFVGGAVVVHQNTRLGSLCMVRGQTRLGRDVPPFFMATGTNQVTGLNRVGLKRAGYGPEQRQQIQAAYTTLYDEGLNVGQAVARLKADFPDGPVAQLAAFV